MSDGLSLTGEGREGFGEEPCSHSHRVTVKKRILVISLMALFLYYNLLIINNIYIIIDKKRENVCIPKK